MQEEKEVSWDQVKELVNKWNSKNLNDNDSEIEAELEIVNDKSSSCLEDKESVRKEDIVKDNKECVVEEKIVLHWVNILNTVLLFFIIALLLILFLTLPSM